MIGYGRFRKDSAWLLKANLLRIAFILAGVGVLVATRRPDWGTVALYGPSMFLIATPGVAMTALGLLLGAGVYYASGNGLSVVQPALIGGVVLATPALMATFHSVCHNSLKPRWLNRTLGEAIGLVHMAGVDEWSTVHAIHHMHPDDPENDPHPPQGRTFRDFLKAYTPLIAAGFSRHVEKSHGAAGLANLGRAKLAIKARQLSLALFWFLLLGPQLFVFAFAVNIVAKKLMYVWFNWATHVRGPDGRDEIIDIDHGVYAFVNRIGFNVFFHRSHHERPQLFIPRAA